MNKVDKLLSLLTLWEKKKVELEYIKDKFSKFSGLIYIVSDIHIPFFDEDAVNRFIKDLKVRTPDLVIICGDLVNLDIFSKYDYVNSADADKELEKAEFFIKMLFKYVDNIIYIASNHEQRLEKCLIRHLGVEKAKQLFNIGFLYSNLLKQKTLHILSNWFVQLGDCVIAHPEVQSIIRARALDWTIEYFEIRIKNLSCVLIGHTHKQSKIFRHKILGVEVGCLAKTQDYVVSSKFNPYRGEVQYLGYAYTELHKGCCDINKTDFVNIKFEDVLL